MQIDLTSANITDEAKIWYANARPNELAFALETAYKIMADFTLKFPTEQLTHTTSATKGAIGEGYVEDILRKKYLLANTSKKAASGDIQVEHNGLKVMVEVKNYSRPVQSAEIIKFKRDLFSCHTDAGVFISLASKICTIGDDFTISYETIDDRTIPVVYLVSSDPELISKSVEIVSAVHRSNNYLINELYPRDKIADSIAQINTSVDTLTKSRCSLFEDITAVNRTLMQNYQRFLSSETAIRESTRKVSSKVANQRKVIESNSHNEIINKYCGKAHESVRGLILDVMSAVAATDTSNAFICANVPVWKLLRNKIIHVSGQGIIFSGSKAEFISAERVPEELMSRAVCEFLKKIRIDERLYVEICDETKDFINLIIEH